MRADLSALVDTLYEVAAEPFCYSDEAAFERRVRALRDGLPDELPIELFYIELAELMASLNDVHCGLSPTFYADYLTAGGLLLPLELSLRAEGVYVEDDYSIEQAVPRWSRLLALDEWSADELTARATALAGAQRPGLRLAFAPYRFALYCWLGPRARYRLTLRSGAATRTVEIGARPRADIDELKVQRDPFAARSYGFALLEPHGLGYLDYRHCEDGPAFEHLLNHAAATMRARRSQGLIVDLRRNGGGDSDVSDLLLRRLARSAYAQEGVVQAHISDRLKHEYGHDRFVKVYQQAGWAAPSGALIDLPMRSMEPFDDDRALHVPVVFLIGVKTLSSGLECAVAVHDYGLGTLIGEETGQPVTSTSELYQTRLPQSGIGAFFATKIINPPKSHPEGRGLVPDVVVVPTHAELAAGDDVALHRAIETLSAVARR